MGERERKRKRDKGSQIGSADTKRRTSTQLSLLTLFNTMSSNGSHLVPGTFNAAYTEEKGTCIYYREREQENHILDDLDTYIDTYIQYDDYTYIYKHNGRDIYKGIFCGTGCGFGYPNHHTAGQIYMYDYKIGHIPPSHPPSICYISTPTFCHTAVLACQFSDFSVFS